MQKAILIIEDDLLQREMMNEVLQQAGYKVLMAENGPEGYETALLEQPDLILLDVIMPDVDGFEVCSHFRADIETAGIPIILLTALNDEDSILAGFRAGASGFISKPWGHQELLSQVRIQLCRAIVDRERRDNSSYPFTQHLHIL